jgi:SAM-dependent methyltransferase
MSDLPVPPREMRLWVGPFGNEELFRRSGRETVALLESMCELRPDHAVLDVGCGCGRVALALADFLSPAGRYLGFDAGLPPVEWCKEHIEPRRPNFRFVHVDVRHPGYHPGGTVSPEVFPFPCESATFDIVLLSSIFTHLLPAAVEAYTREVARVLRPGGRCLISYLLMNEAAREAVATGATIFDFRHWLGPCATFAPGEPTEGLAYREDYALGLLRASGLEVEEVRYGDWRRVRSYEIQHDWVAAVRTGAERPNEPLQQPAGSASGGRTRAS